MHPPVRRCTSTKLDDSASFGQLNEIQKSNLHTARALLLEADWQSIAESGWQPQARLRRTDELATLGYKLVIALLSLTAMLTVSRALNILNSVRS
jgi:hypothetical protein